MTLESFDIFYYTLAFIVPGFVMNMAYSVSVPQKIAGDTALPRFLYFSCIHYALWSWFFYISAKTNFSTIHPVRYAAFWVFIILVSPYLLGLITGALSKKDVFRNALQQLGINPISAIPTAWDYKFSRTGPRWVIVSLIDGCMVAGLFGSDSFASSEADERDIYLEKVFCIDEKGAWVMADRTDGILIKGDQIRTIEFKT